MRAFVALLLSAVALAACAEVPADPEDRAEFERINDPIEPFNRVVFDVNVKFDHWLARPVARRYRDWVPDWVRARIHNMVLNIDDPWTFANDVLQGEPDRAAQTLVRFFFNSTVGLAGAFDVIAATGGPRHHGEDFGQTLAVWGAPEGPYVMLPFYGPSNPRDMVGRAAAWFGDPADLLLAEASDAATSARFGLDTLDTRTDLLDPIDELERSSLDFYAAVRSLYRQNRANDIANRDQPLTQFNKPAGAGELP
ncbi:MAG: VacJ family lipoprotein [Actinomycetota bacterium]